MRPALGVFVALLVVLAGCTSGGGPTTTPAVETTDDPGSSETTTTETTTPGETTTTTTTTETTTTTTPGDTTTTPGDTTTTTTTPGKEMVTDLPDPDSDRLGWEAGIWHNETIGVTNEDGMNATERTLAVARTMARIELVRETEFPGNRTVSVQVRSRKAFRQNQTENRNYSETFRAFDNVKFEAMLFVDDSEDSIDVQNKNRGSTVAGYYDPKGDAMVLVSESELPQFDGEGTLSHELVHALQDRKFNLSTVRGDGTRDGHNAYLGLVEGDANYVQNHYMDRCEAGWACIGSSSGPGGPGNVSDIHFGIYFVQFFPYSDGPSFIRYHLARGGWDRIASMYDDPPASAEQIIYPDKYGSDVPAAVELTDQTGEDWQRLRPEPQQDGSQRPDYARLGPSALASMFMYTAYVDRPNNPVVNPLGFVNFGDGPGGINASDPLDYGFEFLSGWDGDRLHAYRNAGTGETAYAWRLVWDSSDDAEAFTRKYRQLLRYWGAQQVGPETYTIADGQRFDGGYHVSVSGDTVTIAHAPATDQLEEVYAPAGS